MLKNTFQSVANVVDGDVILVRASDLQDNLLDLVDLNLVPIWNGMLCMLLIILRLLTRFRSNHKLWTSSTYAQP